MKRIHLMALVGLIGASATISCSTVKIRVPVMRPAEINLRGKNEIVIGGIEGPSSARVHGELKDAIARSGRFKLIDRGHLDKVMRELSISQSDLADSKSRRKLGRLMTGSIMLVGRVEKSRYDETTGKKKSQCTKRVGKGKAARNVQYTCWHYLREGVVNVAMNFDLIDIETGENIKPKRLSCRQSRRTSAIDGTAPSIDGQGMLDACHSQSITEFMKAIAPWQDSVMAPFRKDSDVPLLEVGIAYAKRGEWENALEKFKAAVAFVDTHTQLSADVIAMAHWDLGLAYEYTFQFDAAIAEVKKAYDMTLNEDFLGELGNIKRLRADQKKLREQTGEDGDS